MSNPCRLDNTAQNKIAYAIGYENGRADTIDKVLQIIHNTYTQDLHCAADYCERDIQGYDYDCKDCLYKSIKQNLIQLKEQYNGMSKD